MAAPSPPIPEASSDPLRPEEQTDPATLRPDAAPNIRGWYGLQI